VTTLPKAQITTKAVVQLGHDRWKIENEGFNELTNRQHGAGRIDGRRTFWY